MKQSGLVEQVPLMDIEAVALRLGVPVRHVRRLVAERRIPFLKWSHLLRSTRLRSRPGSTRRRPG
jgi:excisionase family DNA binding protein